MTDAEFRAFSATMDNIGIDLPGNLEQAIINAATIVIDEIKSSGKVPYDEGTLYRSIRARIVDGDFLGINMEEYGWYLNYGVTGLKNKTKQFGVPEPVASQLNVNPGHIFKFGVKPEGKHYWGIHYPGIDARQWLNIEDVINRVAVLVNQNLEL